MEQSLALSWPAIKRLRRTVLLNLRNMPAHRPPPAYLPFIVRATTAVIITAVPLKPTSRILVIDPPLLAPYGKWLRRIDSKKIQFRIVAFRAKLRLFEPIRRKFVAAVRHILSAKNTKAEHLLRRQFRLEVEMKIAAGRCGQRVSITLLHLVVDFDPAQSHRRSRSHAVRDQCRIFSSPARGA